MKSIGVVIGGIVTVVLAILAIVWFFAFIGSIKGCDPGTICVVREGGPLDGRAISEVRQPGSGAKPIGTFNHQDAYPITERDLTLSSNITESDSGEVDRIPVSTSDAVLAYPEGKLVFRLTTDPELIRRFARSYGRRKWDGKDLSSEDGWKAFLRIRIRPILSDALRQSIGSNTCVSLNNLCQYITQADDAVRGDVREVVTSQNLSVAQIAITKEVQEQLRAVLGADYFEGVQFQNLRIGFEDQINNQITVALTRRTGVATAKLEAEQALVAARGVTKVREQEAKQIKAKAQAYERNPYQARIDYVKALCGDAGCQNLQVIGGGGVITNLR